MDSAAEKAGGSCGTWSAAAANSSVSCTASAPILRWFVGAILHDSERCKVSQTWKATLTKEPLRRARKLKNRMKRQHVRAAARCRGQSGLMPLHIGERLRFARCATQTLRALPQPKQCARADDEHMFRISHACAGDTGALTRLRCAAAPKAVDSHKSLCVSRESLAQGVGWPTRREANIKFSMYVSQIPRAGVQQAWRECAVPNSGSHLSRRHANSKLGMRHQVST